MIMRRTARVSNDCNPSAGRRSGSSRPPERAKRVEGLSAARSWSGLVGPAVQQHFVVEVRARRPAGRADVADDVAALDVLAGHHREAREVAVARGDAEAVVERRRGCRSCRSQPGAQRPCRRRWRRPAGPVGGDVEAGVEVRGAGERVAAGCRSATSASRRRPDRRRRRGQRLAALRPGPEAIQLRLEPCRTSRSEPEGRIPGGDGARDRRGQIARSVPPPIARWRDRRRAAGPSRVRPAGSMRGGAERVGGVLQAGHCAASCAGRVAVVRVLDLQRRVLPQQIGNHRARAPRRPAKNSAGNPIRAERPPPARGRR